MHRFIFIGLALVLLLGGCYSKQVLHLASDASLLKVGESTRQDVLRYLGEPNGHRSVAPGIQEYVYYETRKGALGRAPLVGSMVPAEGHEMLILTLTGDLVTGSEFRTVRKTDKEWVDDFTWDEVK